MSPVLSGRVSTSLAVGLWFVLALIFVLVSGNYQALIAELAGRPTGYPDIALACDSLNVCMRAGVLIFEQATIRAFDFVSHLMYMPDASSALFPQSPWGRLGHGASEHVLVARTAAFVVVRVICLVPLLCLALAFFQTLPARVLFLTAAFLTLSGWPPPLLDIFFSAFRLIADWPLSYYLFSAQLGRHDFGSLAFICLLALYIARRRRKTLWEIAGMTLLGQIMFENNGLVAGVAFFVDAFFNPAIASAAERRRIAFVRLGVAAAVTLALVASFGALYSLRNTGAAAGGFGPVGSITTYLQDYWHNFGRINFLWLNVTIANFVVLTVVPLAVGLTIGAIGALGGKVLRQQSQDAIRATLAAASGFFAAVLVGLFVSGLSSDMGRQLLPLALIVLTAAAKIGEAAVAKRQHGAA